ncbi:pyruvate ferredoxin oxidoreductase, partial [bacterium]|nr:pyruvate ferredoxin oxidoreductase [bacterium]
ASAGRSWGGLTWEYLLDDAEVVLVAAGSLVTQLTLVVEMLRAEGVKAGVLGIRCYRPFPVAALREKLAGRALALVFDKALSYGYQGPIAEDLKAALYAAENAPAVYGHICGLGGRDVSPEQLAAAARAGLSDLRAGITDRDPVWINLAEGSMR